MYRGRPPQTFEPLDVAIRGLQGGAAHLMSLGQWRFAYRLLDQVPGQPSRCWPIGAELAALRPDPIAPPLR